jgi:hypothetical protein
MVPAWEVKPLDDSVASFALGQSGVLTFRVVARRKGDIGRGLPNKISTGPPIEATFSGQVVSSTAADGVVESTWDVEVKLPASDQPGLKRAELMFIWADGRSEKMPLGWEVRPRIRSVPAGLVLRYSSEPIKRTIVVESESVPFKLIRVDSRLLASPVTLPEKPAKRHAFDVKLDLSKGPFGRAENVKITTDRPEQPAIHLSVLILPDAPGRGE